MLLIASLPFYTNNKEALNKNEEKSITNDWKYSSKKKLVYSALLYYSLYKKGDLQWKNR